MIRSEMRFTIKAKNGIPIIVKTMQNALPSSVFGVMLPYPIVVATVPAKKKELWKLQLSVQSV